MTVFAVYVGIVHTHLPFMILPLYANFVKLDETYLEASADLGARPVTTFITVTLPLPANGIMRVVCWCSFRLLESLSLQPC